MATYGTLWHPMTTRDGKSGRSGRYICAIFSSWCYFLAYAPVVLSAPAVLAASLMRAAPLVLAELENVIIYVVLSRIGQFCHLRCRKLENVVIYVFLVLIFWGPNLHLCYSTRFFHLCPFSHFFTSNGHRKQVFSFNAYRVQSESDLPRRTSLHGNCMDGTADGSLL